MKLGTQDSKTSPAPKRIRSLKMVAQCHIEMVKKYAKSAMKMSFCLEEGLMFACGRTCWEGSGL